MTASESDNIVCTVRDCPAVGTAHAPLGEGVGTTTAQRLEAWLAMYEANGGGERLASGYQDAPLLLADVKLAIATLPVVAEVIRTARDAHAILPTERRAAQGLTSVGRRQYALGLVDGMTEGLTRVLKPLTALLPLVPEEGK